MPLYEFICPKCGKRTENFSAMSDRDKTRSCEYCGEELVRMMANVSHVIEGYCYRNTYAKPEITGR